MSITVKEFAATQQSCSKFSNPIDRIKSSGKFGLEDLELIAATFAKCGSQRGTTWDNFRSANLTLPAWFNSGLDPFSEQYEAQQKRLWSLLTGVNRDYSPEKDEENLPYENVDPVRFPGYFRRTDADAITSASDHVIAMGMILKHCGLRRGDSALEYGAGFAQTAVHLARLGVAVDTVDISDTLCRFVKEQADFFNISLTPFNGQFGFNPRGMHQYDLIWFYESFHHCLEFKSVVHQIKRHLAPGGRVLLAGEPITTTQTPSVPYPWGLRLHSEVVAMINKTRWFELGFNEDFLIGLFTNAGFSAHKFPCPVSIYGEGYIFRHRSDSIELATQWLPHALNAGWHGPEARGRWTKEQSVLHVDATESFKELLLEVTNHHSVPQTLELVYGEAVQVICFNPGERREVSIKAGNKARQLVLRTNTHVPVNSVDTRALGIFVHRLRYQ